MNIFLRWVTAGMFSALCLTVSSTPARSDINASELKDTYNLLAPEYQHLSPLYGAVQLETGTLSNRRFFGNYGAKKNPFGCLEKEAPRIHEVLRQKADCPQDSSSELLQRLFPAQDGVNFVANQVHSDFVSHLTPGLVGQLLGVLSKAKEVDLNTEAGTIRIKDDLKDALYKAFNPEGYYRTRLSKLQKQERSCKKGPEKTQCQLEISGLREILKIYEDLPESGSQSNRGNSSAASASAAGRSNEEVIEEMNEQIKKGIGKEKDFEAFAELVVRSLKESMLNPKTYPAHFTEHMLLSFVIKKSNDKKDLLKFFKGLEAQNSSVFKDPDSLKSREKQDRFIASEYSANDYHSERLEGDPKTVAKDLMAHPVDVFFHAVHQAGKTKAFPTLLSYGSVKHESLQNESPEKQEYPDCGETSLRNFFNIMFYKQSKEGSAGFDVGLLGEIKKSIPGLSPHPGLTDFYEKHSQPPSAIKQETRKDWSDLVSGHKGPAYLKPGKDPSCEINAGIDNMMILIDRLLFHNPNIQEGSISKAQDRAGKLDELCKIFSREGYHLTWSAGKESRQEVNQRDKNLDIAFSINDVPTFEWSFSNGHFSIRSLLREKPSWKRDVGPELSKELATSQPPQLDSPLLGLVTTSYNFKSITKKAQPHQRPRFSDHLAYSLPLMSAQEKLKAINVLYESHEEDPEKRSNPLGRRLLAKLPDDQYTYDECFDLLHDTGFLRQDFPLFTPMQRSVAFLQSAKRNDLSFFTFLLEKGFVPDVTDREGNSPAHMAAEGGSSEILMLLLEKFPDQFEKLNKYKSPPALISAKRGYFKEVQAMLQAFPKTANAQDRDSLTIANWALHHRNIQTLEVIAQKAPDAFLARDLMGNTILHQTVSLGPEWFKIVFTAAPKMIDLKDSSGRTALHTAISYGDLSSVKLVSELSPQSFTVEDNDNRNAGHLAAYYQKWEMLEIIIKAAPDCLCEIDGEANTVLKAAQSMHAPDKVIRAIRKATDKSQCSIM